MLGICDLEATDQDQRQADPQVRKTWRALL